MATTCRLKFVRQVAGPSWEYQLGRVIEGVPLPLNPLFASLVESGACRLLDSDDT